MDKKHFLLCTMKNLAFRDSNWGTKPDELNCRPPLEQSTVGILLHSGQSCVYRAVVGKCSGKQSKLEGLEFVLLNDGQSIQYNSNLNSIYLVFSIYLSFTRARF